MPGIRNRIAVLYGNESFVITDGPSIAQYWARTEMLDLRNEATDRADAERRAALHLARVKGPTTSIEATLRHTHSDVVPWGAPRKLGGSGLWVHDIVSGPSADASSVDYEIDAMTVVAGDGGYIASVKPDLGDRRQLLSEYQMTLLERAARGSGGGRNMSVGSSLVPDEFEDVRTGRMPTIQGPNWSKPDDITVGTSGKWIPDVVTRVTAIRITSDLSGVGDTIVYLKRNGVVIPTVFLILPAGAVFAQSIVYNQIFTPGIDTVQVTCTAAGGHTQVNIQTTAASAL